MNNTNKKGLGVLLIIFVLMYLLNSMAPMMNEDYFAAFVWPFGVPNLGELPIDAKRVSCFSVFLENTKVYYLTEGGRVPGGMPGSFFSWQGKIYFNPLNALMFALLIVEIYWISHEGTITLDFDPKFLFWIFFSLWSFNIGFLGTCLWMSGSSNYLWMTVINLAFLIPYIKSFYNNDYLINDTLSKKFCLFFLGVLAGWCHETTNCWLIVILFYALFLHKGNNCSRNVQQWRLCGFIGLCIGYALLILAPGNFARLHTQEHELLAYKLSEHIIIFAFHLLLWYFVIKSLYILHEVFPQLTKKQKSLVKPYMDIAKAFMFIAFGSGVLLFLIPVSSIRPSFLNLVFLTVAVATVYRIQERIGIFVIRGVFKPILKFIGYSYFAVTMLTSLWWNHHNWNYWNGVLLQINNLVNNEQHIVLEVEPYETMKNPFWQYLSGFHIFGMPVLSDNENERINRVVARYYNIKGIRLKNN